jgi:hypothetical protein
MAQIIAAGAELPTAEMPGRPAGGDPAQKPLESLHQIGDHDRGEVSSSAGEIFDDLVAVKGLAIFTETNGPAIAKSAQDGVRFGLARDSWEQ